MIQHDFEKIEFRYIPDGSGCKPDITGLNAQARKIIHPSVELSAVEVEALPPGPSGKFEEFVSQVPASRIPLGWPGAGANFAHFRAWRT